MPVLGGLHIFIRNFQQKQSFCFNTDDGIRRAAIMIPTTNFPFSILVSIPMTVLGGLQYCIRKIYHPEQRSFNTHDVISRAEMRIYPRSKRRAEGFNTDDGIRRAAIRTYRAQTAYAI